MEAKKLIGGLLAGVAVGIAIGMLLAPASGKESSEKLVKGSQKLAHKVKKGVKGYTSSLQDKYNRGVEDVAKKGKEVINGLSE